MTSMTSPIDVVLSQIGVPNGLKIRNCGQHGKFLVPKRSKFQCPHCTNLHAVPNGTGGNGDGPEITQAKSAVITAMKHYICLGG